MRYVGMAVVIAGNLVITGLMWISLLIAGHPIEELAKRVPFLGKGLLATAGPILGAIVTVIRDRVDLIVPKASQSAFYPLLDAFIVFDIAILIWIFLMPLLEGIGREKH